MITLREKYELLLNEATERMCDAFVAGIMADVPAEEFVSRFEKEMNGVAEAARRRSRPAQSPISARHVMASR